MTPYEKIIEIINSSSNGTVTTHQIVEQGIHRNYIKKLIDEGRIYRYSRGVYILVEAWEDDMFLLQKKYSRGIFSDETALYLHGYSDRTPTQYNLTFPKGYNAPSLSEESVKIKRVIPENYFFGITEITSPCGNPIKVYDLERTLCDIVRGLGADIQIVNTAMKKYADSPNKNVHRLMEYAEKLHVMPKINRYMQVLL